jgi:hypothetical protein
VGCRFESCWDRHEYCCKWPSVEQRPVVRRRSPEIGEDRLDNLVIIAVFLIAVAQALTILLTIRRERDIKELARLVDKQRLHIVELTAWLAGRNAAQPRRPKPEPEPASAPTADGAKASEPSTAKDLSATAPPRTAQVEGAQAMKVLNWQRHILAGLRAGLKAKGVAPPEPAITEAPEPRTAPKEFSDTMQPSVTEDEPKRATKPFRWFKEDANEPHEIVSAREIVAGLNRGVTPPEPAIAPKDLPDVVQPSSAENELERATRAIDWLKEDADKAREMVANLRGTPPAKKTG